MFSDLRYIHFHLLLVFVLGSMAYPCMAQDLMGSEAQISYKSNFETYQNYPVTCLDGIYQDSQGRYWFADCSVSEHNLTGLYTFDGYAFTFMPFSHAFEASDYNEYTGIINNNLFGYTHSKNGYKLFYYDLQNKKVVYYDTLNQGYNTLRFKGNGEAVHRQNIINDTIYAYHYTRDSIGLNIYDKHTKLLGSYTKSIDKYFDNIDYSSGLPHFYYHKEFVIARTKPYRSYRSLNIVSDKIQHIRGSEMVAEDKNFYLTVNNDNLWTLATDNSYTNYEVTDAPGQGIALTPVFKINKEKITYPLLRYRHFSDKTGNRIILEKNKSAIRAYLSSGGQSYYDISSLVKQVNLSDFDVLELFSDNFTESIALLDSRTLSVQKFNFDSGIYTIAEDNPIRSIIPMNKDLIGYSKRLSADGTFGLKFFNLKDSENKEPKNLCNFNTMDGIQKGNVIWGISQSILKSYNFDDKQCTTYNLDIKLFSLSNFNDNEFILVDSNKQFWLYNWKSGDLQPILEQGNPVSIPSELFFMSKGRDNSLWIACHLGLYHYDFEREVLEKIPEQIAGFDFKFSAIAPYKEHSLLLGTLNNGIVVLDTKANTFSNISTINGLSHNSIASITEDKNGNFWVGTYEGVSVFDSELNHLTNLYEKDGLVYNECNRKSAALLEDGRIAIGGLKGLSIISPDKVLNKLKEVDNFRIYFSEISYYNQNKEKQENLKATFSNEQSIKIGPTNTSLVLEFGTSNYINPIQNTYAYKVEGVDTAWNNLGTFPKLVLSSLAPGNYTLLIKGFDFNGNPTQNSLRLNVEVNNFFYNEAWFYVLNIVLIASLAIFWIISLRKRVRVATEKIQKDKSLIEQQAKKLEALDQTKNRFFTNITHEFRTPITIINSVVDLMKRNKQNISDHELKEIEQNSNQLLSLINQILALRKLESGKMTTHFIQTDVFELVDVTVDSYMYIAQNKGIDLKLSKTNDDFMMDVDLEKFKIILDNLISNALKYTDKGGKVKVKVSTIEDKTLQISIKDTGIGIPESKIKKVFNYFDVSENIFNTENSSGIGLSVSKQFVDLLHGDLKILSKPGEGTSIVLQLPISRNAEKKAINADSYKKDKLIDKRLAKQSTTLKSDIKEQKPRLLFVEDNASLRHILSLQLEGFCIHTAKDGIEGITKAIELIPDIIISDVMMPGKTGFELCNTLKEDKRTSHIPVILLTAMADHESKLKGLKAKADAYLYKPYEFKELTLIINNLLESRQTLQKIYRSLNKDSKATDYPQEDQFILSFKAIIHSHINEENFNVSDLCAILGLSRTALHNKIKALTGLSTSNFILHIKLEKGKKLLMTTTKNINEISFEIGMERSYFSTKFKEKYRLSPKQFRDGLIEKT
jgi:signal transduction histidine kinase/CheY-like chemotaxis protein